MRIAIADDSALFREGLATLLQGAGIEVTAMAASGQELLQLIDGHVPDAVLLDIRMPPTFSDEGIVLAGVLRTRYPQIGVIVLSAYAESAYAARLLEDSVLGIGYLLKDKVVNIASLKDALERVVVGELVIDPLIVERLFRQRRHGRSMEQLSARERDILQLMAEGYSNAGIASKLGLAAKTVEAHVATVFLKLGLSSNPESNRRVLAVLAWTRSHGNRASIPEY